MNSKIEKKQRKLVKKFVCSLLSSMRFIDRLRFVFTGNYYKPMRRTLQRIGGARKAPKKYEK